MFVIFSSIVFAVASGTPKISEPPFFIMDYKMSAIATGSSNNGEFTESPISMNDYGNSTEKCTSWDCNAWTMGAVNSINYYCSSQWNVTEWYGVAPQTYNCSTYTTTAGAGNLTYCSGVYDCINWSADNVCQSWNCTAYTKKVGGTTGGDLYCSGQYNCSAWNNNVCDKWGCTAWTQYTTNQTEKYCGGGYDCTTWNGVNTGLCDTWNCTRWDLTRVAIRDEYCGGGWNCSTKVNGACDKWDCLGWTLPSAANNRYCDTWDCRVWDTTNKICSTWNCTAGFTATGTLRRDSYCTGGFTCKTWQTTTSIVTINLNTPLNNMLRTSLNENFTVTPTNAVSAIANCSLYNNETSWGFKGTNLTTCTSGSSCILNYTFASNSSYLWNAYCCSIDGVCGFATSNYTLNIDTGGPAISSVIVNSTSGYYLATDNLTCVYASNININAIAWNKNGTPDMLVFYPFEGGSSNLSDYSGNSKTLTNNGGVWNSTGGRDGNGAMFIPTGKNLTGYKMEFSNMVSGNGFTISLWFKTKTTEVASLFAQIPTAAFVYNYYMNLENFGTTVAFGVLDSVDYKEVNVVTNSNDGLWHHAVLRVNGNTDNGKDLGLYVFIDGASVGTPVSVEDTLQTSTFNFTIGGWGDYNTFNGSIDDIRVYNYTLTNASILALYNNRTDLIVSNELVLGQNWSCAVTPFSDELAGTTVTSNNITIGTTTCTYSGVGNWAIDFKDNCTISSNVDLGGNNISVTAPTLDGKLTLNANITNFKLLNTWGIARSWIYCLTGCFMS